MKELLTDENADSDDLLENSDFEEDALSDRSGFLTISAGAMHGAAAVKAEQKGSRSSSLSKAQRVE